MAKKVKYDGVVDAAHYNPDGTIEWVRAYERRGPTFSDYVLIPRKALIEKIKSGKVFMAGQRVVGLASTFEVTSQVRVTNHQGKEVLVSGNADTAESDHLENVPII
jgi:hypothetical protein